MRLTSRWISWRNTSSGCWGSISRGRGGASVRRRFNPIREAVEEIRAGRPVIVVDDRARENEGDLVMAGERATPEAVNFMMKYGRGLICVAMTGERLDALRLPLMVDDNTS